MTASGSKRLIAKGKAHLGRCVCGPVESVHGSSHGIGSSSETGTTTQSARPERGRSSGNAPTRHRPRDESVQGADRRSDDGAQAVCFRGLRCRTEEVAESSRDGCGRARGSAGPVTDHRSRRWRGCGAPGDRDRGNGARAVRNGSVPPVAARKATGVSGAREVARGHVGDQPASLDRGADSGAHLTARHGTGP